MDVSIVCDCGEHLEWDEGVRCDCGRSYTVTVRQHPADDSRLRQSVVFYSCVDTTRDTVWPSEPVPVLPPYSHPWNPLEAVASPVFAPSQVAAPLAVVPARTNRPRTSQ